MVNIPTNFGATIANADDRQMLTSAEQSAFVEAELCLMKAPSKLGVTGVKTRWDDLQYNHVVQTNVVHDVVSSFLSSDIANHNNIC